MPGIREKKRARTEADILRSLSYLLAKKGFVKTTVEDIARRAQVGVGTVYNYFGSKNELLLALMQRDTEELLRDGQAILAWPGDEPHAAVSNLFSMYAEKFLSRYDRKMLREVFAAVFYQPEAIGRNITRLDYLLIRQVAELLESFQRVGAIRKSLAVEQAALVLYGAFAILIMMYLQYEEMPLAEVQDRMRSSISLIFSEWTLGVARSDVSNHVEDVTGG